MRTERLRPVDIDAGNVTAAKSNKMHMQVMASELRTSESDRL
jgi:hypothetical protein